MKATKVSANRFRGANKQPSGGVATFDDGRTYDWTRCPHTGEIYFVTVRTLAPGSWKLDGETAFASFRSAKRAAAVEAALAD